MILPVKFKKIIDPRYASYKVYLVIFLVAALVSIFALRHNNTTMIGLRAQVYAADKAGSDVEVPLDKLRAYVYAHMNTNLSSGGNGIKPPIQLKYTYDRLASAAEASANNAGLYTTAENYCQAAVPASVSISGRGRIGCVQDYISSHGGKAPAAIPPALYEFDFASPAWSPDLAGWSLAATAAAFIGLIISYSLHRFKLSRK
jgi:hypothetical protein